MTKEVKRGQQDIEQKRKKAAGNSEGQGGTSIERAFGGRACRLAVFLCAYFLRIEQTRYKIRGREEMTNEVIRGQQSIEQK